MLHGLLQVFQEIIHIIECLKIARGQVTFHFVFRGLPGFGPEPFKYSSSASRIRIDIGLPLEKDNSRSRLY
jgi:hypothetical protein